MPTTGLRRNHEAPVRALIASTDHVGSAYSSARLRTRREMLPSVSAMLTGLPFSYNVSGRRLRLSAWVISSWVYELTLPPTPASDNERAPRMSFMARRPKASTAQAGASTAAANTRIARGASWAARALVRSARTGEGSCCGATTSTRILLTVFR